MKLKLYNSMKTLDPGNVEGSREKKVKLSRFTTFFCSRRRRRRKFEKGKFFCIDLFHPRDEAAAGRGGGRGADWAGVVAAGGGGGGISWFEIGGKHHNWHRTYNTMGCTVSSKISPMAKKNVLCITKIKKP